MSYQPITPKLHKRSNQRPQATPTIEYDTRKALNILHQENVRVLQALDPLLTDYNALYGPFKQPRG